MSKGILFVVSAPAGCGKDSILEKALSKDINLTYSVSATTRAMRAGETEGISYYFKSREEFEKMIDGGELLEHTEYCGNYYGTPKEYVERCLAQGKDVILEIEIQGALKVREKFPQALLLFVMPPDAEELRRRLAGRGTEEDAVIRRRLARAQEESKGIENYEYIIINDDLQACVQEMHAVITAARRAPGRNEEFIADIRSGLSALVKGE